MIAAVATTQGLVVYFKDDDRALTVPLNYRANAVLHAKPGIWAISPEPAGWHNSKPVPGIRIWTDNYSNVLRVVLRKRFGW